uniref:Phytocyanin domain-containing protein n=1 Tax=Leersia perrieri TaxID=77586 RepID=A0A0D9WR54_9ORYZ
MAQRDQAAVFLLCFFLLAGSWCCASAAVLLLTRTGTQYVVGGKEKWRTPDTLDMYAKWAAAVHFYVGDTIEFVYKNDSVVKTDKFGFYHCNVTGTTANDGSVLFLLDEPGFAYFTSSNVAHCKKGQRLMLTIESAPAPAPSPASPVVRPPAAKVIMTPPPSKSPSPSPAPQEPAATTSAAPATMTATAMARALVLAVSATAVAVMGLVLGEW